MSILDLKLFSLQPHIVTDLLKTCSARFLVVPESGSEGRVKNCHTKQCCSKALDFTEKANFHFARGFVAAKYFRCQLTADSKGSIKAT